MDTSVIYSIAPTSIEGSIAFPHPSDLLTSLTIQREFNSVLPVSTDITTSVELVGKEAIAPLELNPISPDWQNVIKSSNFQSRIADDTHSAIKIRSVDQLTGMTKEGMMVSKQNYEDEYLVGDWDGDGRDNLATRRGNTILMDTNFDGQVDQQITFAVDKADQYLVGDWDGDGKDNIAVRQGAQILMDINFDGKVDLTQIYGSGRAEDQYLVGDWNGDGKDNVAVRRGSTILMDTNFDGQPNLKQVYGLGKDENQYLVGDWDGDGKDNIAVRRDSTVLMDTNRDGKHDFVQMYGLGKSESQYLIGDWDGDGDDNLAVRRNKQVLMDDNFEGGHDIEQTYGKGTDRSVTPPVIIPGEKLIDIAKKYIGVRERGGENRGSEVEMFQKAVDGKAHGEAWCMSFVQYCVKTTEKETGSKSKIFRSEGVLATWNNSPKELRLDKPEPGSIVIWRHGTSSQGHTGIVEKVNRDGSFVTIEGNTGDGQGIVREGDGVYRRTRSMNNAGKMKIVGFLKPF